MFEKLTRDENIKIIISAFILWLKSKREILKIVFFFCLLLVVIWIISGKIIKIDRPLFWYLCGVFGVEGSGAYGFVYELLFRGARAITHFIRIFGISFGEEIVFRGPFLILLKYSWGSKYVKCALAAVYVIFSSSVFAAYGNPMLENFWVLGSYISRFLLGVFLCWVIWRTMDSTLKVNPISIAILFHAIYLVAVALIG